MDNNCETKMVFTKENAANKKLFMELHKWWVENSKGGFKCQWRRKSIIDSRIIQRMGIHKKVKAPLFFGEKMVVVTGETISRGLLVFGYTELSISALMLAIIKPDQTVIDIGAHFGFESLLAARLVGENGKVYSFEPVTSAYEIAQENLSSYKQVILEKIAITEKTGEITVENRPVIQSAFNRTINGEINSNSEKVKSSTLDEIIKTYNFKVDFIKCDVEGSEMNVLQGAKELLSCQKPVIVLEVGMPGEISTISKRENLINYLEPYQYKPFAFNYNGNLIISDQINSMKNHANLLFLTNYHINYLKKMVN